MFIPLGSSLRAEAPRAEGKRERSKTDVGGANDHLRCDKRVVNIMLINMHNIHNLWSPQKCASVNAVQTGLCIELRHLLNQPATQTEKDSSED